MRCNCGPISFVISCCERDRCDQSTSGVITKDCDTSGVPLIVSRPRTSGTPSRILSTAAAYRPVYVTVAPSGPVPRTRMMPRSSSGESSDFSSEKKTPLIAATPRVAMMMIGRIASAAPSTRLYPFSNATNPFSSTRNSQDGSGLWRSSFVHIIGVSVSATNPETITAPARVKANSVNSRPVFPGAKAIGAYTAASVNVIAMTAKPISFRPRAAAATGSIPSSIWRYIFSSTTMASSTTRPIASTIARSVSVLTLNPNANISAKVAISDTGIVTIGMIAARNERRKNRMTKTTSAMASPIVV